MNNFFAFSWLVLISVSVSAAQTPVPTLQGKPARAEIPGSLPIGSAKMLPDKTVVLTLRAETDGAIGDAQFSYKPSDPKSAEIIKHVGGLKPGMEKVVLPFPEREKQ